MINQRYSYKSFKGKSFVSVSSKDFANTEIIGASFYQPEPHTDVFPKLAHDEVCTLTRCNLDNCNLPEGYVAKGGTNKHILSQNDEEYWIVDKDLNPIEPRDKSKFIDLGLSIDPRDIPVTKLKEPITYTNDPKVIEQRKIDELVNDEARLKEIVNSDEASIGGN